MKECISTPDLSCITDEDRNRVYEPAEDTFLLLDALEQDCALIRARRPTIVLEVGSGSGVVSTFISKLITDPALVLCTDINPYAANLTRRLSAANGQHVEVVLTDLASCCEQYLYKKVDVLLFNPPYVVTPSEEVGTNDISASWAGGLNGREVLDKLLPKIGDLLSPNGIFYLVAIKENNIDEIGSALAKQGLSTVKVLERRSGPEMLMTLRAEKSTNNE